MAKKKTARKKAATKKATTKKVATKKATNRKAATKKAATKKVAAKKAAKKKAAAKKTTKKDTPLKRFLVVYHSPASAMKKMMTASAEEKAAGMEQWMKWGAKCGDHLVDFGAPVMGGLNFKSAGPPVASRRKVSGYSFLQAKSAAAAKKLVQGHPHLAWTKGCEIELHEVIPMG